MRLTGQEEISMARPLRSSRDDAAAGRALLEPLESRVLLSVSLASTTASGSQLNANSQDSALSADGRFIAFTSNADTLVPNDNTQSSDVFVHNIQSGTTTTLVSAATTGAAANGASIEPDISADGLFVAFTSSATNLVPNYT